MTFEIELAKAVDVTIDYILFLIEKKKERGKPLGLVVVAELMSLVSSDPELRSKKELIQRFIETLDAATDGSAVGDEWKSFAEEMCQKELDAIVSGEQLRMPGAEHFARECLRTGSVPVDGEALSRILPPMSRFTPDGKRDEIRARVAERLKVFVQEVRRHHIARDNVFYYSDARKARLASSHQMAWEQSRDNVSHL